MTLRLAGRLLLQIVGLITILAVVTAAITIPFLAVWLQPQDKPERSDYIVVLAGDEHRFIKAAELYKQNYAPVILLSNEYIPPKSRIQELITELGYPNLHPYEFRQRVLEHLGVPKEAMASFGSGSVSTAEEAEALRGKLGSQPAKIILVTSPFHARRAKITFGSAMPNASFLVVSPPERTISGKWWSDQQSAMLTAQETLKLVYFWLGSAFRAVPLSKHE